MSWLSELAKVYDNVVNNDDKPLPIYHWANNASVTIILDGNGNFIKATLIDKKDTDRITVMPSTESCANRTSGADAYPLCDKWEYVAENSVKNELYKTLLKSWAESEYSNQKIKAVYTYVCSGTIVSDLEKSGIKKDDISDFIRWEVQIAGDVNSCLWKDKDTQSKWIEFYNSDTFDDYCRKNFSGKDAEKRIRKIDVDYVDGERSKIAMYHPSKIRNAGSSAKLISANDTSNFTFRGRFLNDSEACLISSETTQKAHSALRWLIKRQGVSLGDGFSVVTWNRAGSEFPSITVGSTDILPVISTEENKIEESEDFFQELDFGLDEIEENQEPRGIYSTSKEFSDAINNRLHGYYGDISNPQKIMIMAVKEATPGQGRVSIVLYRELLNTDLLEKLDYWYKSLAWDITYWANIKKENGKKKMPIYTIGTPSPKTIAECAYGERVKSALIEKTVQRLLSCILDGGLIPSDLETQCVKSASNLLAIEGYRREIVLQTACAVYKYNHNKEEYKLALEENRQSRDYLFGRLLAVEHQYENAALSKAGESRETNAVRYMQQFSLHPAKTWLMLYKDKLPAYRRHLDAGLANWFEKLIQDITALFEPDEYMNDAALSGEFLLGYHCQLKAFRKNYNESLTETEE